MMCKVVTIKIGGNSTLSSNSSFNKDFSVIDALTFGIFNPYIQAFIGLGFSWMKDVCVDVQPFIALMIVKL